MNNTNNSSLRSKLGKARGLGSAKHGVSHWWLQRLTALAIAPLAIWFMGSVISIFISPDVFTVARWFSYPINAIALTLLCFVLFFHAKLGLQVVVEDYIKSPFSKYSLLILNSFFCFAGFSVCLIAILKLHFLNIAGI